MTFRSKVHSCYVAVLLLAVIGARPAVAQRPAVSAPRTPSRDCYRATVLVLSTGDSAASSISRLVSTGIRRFRDNGSGSPYQCIPADTAAARSHDDGLWRLVDSAAVSPRTITRATFSGTALDRVRAELQQLERRARTQVGAGGAGLQFIEVADAAEAAHSAPELPLRDPPAVDSTARACRAKNERLASRHAGFHFAC